ncbi:MAG: hypothetical protein IJI22_04475 [Bacilli bacterium]|nr:hypothetical protein [Bacilli bacterium]
MIDIKDILNKNNIKVKKITYYDNYVITESDDNKYLIKNRDSNKSEIFDYLKSIKYPYYLDIINSYNDYYEIYPYYDDKVVDKYSKGKKIIEALSLLQLKSLSYKEYSEDNIKGIYEDLVEKIDNTMKYYLDLQDYIEEFIFPNPAYYLLIKNISKFYELLRLGRLSLDKWYQNTKDNKLREVLLVNNVSLNNFCFGDYQYFIDYRDAHWGLVSYDFAEFYKNDLFEVDMISLFDYYKSLFNIDQNEYYLLCSLISIPVKIKFSRTAYNDTVYVRSVVDYVLKTIEFISEENEKYQEADKDKFEQENEDI